MHAQIWQGAEGSDVHLLSVPLLGICGPRSDQRGEIPNSVDFVSRENLRAEFRQIQPAVGSLAETAVVKIESVDVDVRL